MKNNTLHTFVALAALGCLLLLTDPFMYWMPEAAQMLVLLGVTVLLAVWVGFVANERAADEREAEHRMFAGRVAYLSCIAVLAVALLVQGLTHAIDPWIAAALAVMIVSKLAAHYYSSWYR